MYEELRALFGKGTPSVSKFEKILSDLPEAKRLYFRRLAYKTALCEWDELNTRYQLFLTRFFKHDWQHTLEFLKEQTVLGTLPFELQEPDIILRFIGLMEGKEFGYNSSFVHLAFSLMLVFPYKGSVEYMGDKLRDKTLTAEDLVFLNDRTPLTNETGHVPLLVKQV